MNIQDGFQILGSQTQTAAVGSVAYALTPGSHVMVTNESATVIARIKFGNSSVVALSPASTSIPPNGCRQFSVNDGSTFIALITDATTASVNITTGEGVSSS